MHRLHSHLGEGKGDSYLRMCETKSDIEKLVTPLFDSSPLNVMNCSNDIYISMQTALNKRKFDFQKKKINMHI